MIKGSQVASAGTAFACKLFAQLAEHSHGKNLFISPASVALALAMVYNAARGETRRAMAGALALGDADADDINQANADLAHQLGQIDPHVELAIANALWVSDAFQLSGEFVSAAEGAYQAAIRPLDFAHGPAAAVVNGWVAEHTRGKISKIVEQLDRDTLLLLVNAIYFKGSWTEPFSRQLTHEAPFNCGDGRQIQHPLMAQRGRFRYYEDRAFQAVSLPYGGGRVCMYVFLPRPESSLGAFSRSLTAKSWDAWMGRFAQAEGRLALPRFRAEYAAKLNDALKALGMGIAFEPRADFGAMARDGTRLKIDEVRHKTFVEVNEEGTEAAAATSVGMLRASFMPQKSFSMVVDRPFFCAIRDERTGVILFMGSIVDPAS